MMIKNRRERQLEAGVISSAIDGDTAAISKIMSFYQGYILKLSIAYSYKDGSSHPHIDESIRQALSVYLIEKILSFKIA